MEAYARTCFFKRPRRGARLPLDVGSRSCVGPVENCPAHATESTDRLAAYWRGVCLPPTLGMLIRTRRVT
jgi:hypothetical protein